MPSLWGFPFPFSPGPPKEIQTKERGKGKTKEKFSLRAGPARSPLLPHPAPPTPPPASLGQKTTSSSSSHSSCSKGGARVTILPTFVSHRKVRTVGVARSSWKSRLTVGARGHFCSRAFLALLPQPLYLRNPGSKPDEKVMARLSLAATTPPALVGPARFVLAKYGPIAAWPERSWKHLMATPFPSLLGSLNPNPWGGGG